MVLKGIVVVAGDGRCDGGMDQHCNGVGGFGWGL